MAGMWFATGRKANVLERANGGFDVHAPGTNAVTVTTMTSDTNFPVPYLYDGRLGSPWRQAALSGGTIRVDTEMLSNGTFEGAFPAGVPADWTKSGTGTVADDTTHQRTGAHCVAITPPNNSSTQISQDNFYGYARAGDSYKISAWGKVQTPGTGNQAQLYVYNLLTQHYLQPDGTWSISATPVALNTTGAYVELTKTFTMESYEPYESALGIVQPVLHVILLAAGGSAASAVYFDDAHLFPGVNCAAVFGHNLPTADSSPIVVTVESTPDDSFFTVRSPNPILTRWPAYYWLDTSSIFYDRYWHLRFFNAPTAQQGPYWIGEYFLGQAHLALRSANYPIRTTFRTLQQRQTGFSGTQLVYATADAGPRAVALGTYSSRGTWPSAQMLQIRDELFRRSQNGVWPVLLIPQDNDPHGCFFGRLPDTAEVAQTFLPVGDWSGLVLQEDPIQAPLA